MTGQREFPKCNRDDCFAWFDDGRFGRCVALRDTNFICQKQCPFYQQRYKWRDRDRTTATLAEYASRQGNKDYHERRVMDCYTVWDMREGVEFNIYNMPEESDDTEQP